MKAKCISVNPFVTFPRINKIFTLFDSLRDQHKKHGAVSCVLITGESGSGKSEIAARYLKKNPEVQESERIFKPVIWYELKSVSTRKGFIQKLLVAIGDPQMGMGAVNEDELYDRLVRLCSVIGLELLILDEIQVIIERRSLSVLSGLADLFKDLIKDLNIPIVFMGMPWSKYLIESNKQLSGRISYRHTIPPFRASIPSYLSEYRKLLKKLSDYYEFPEKLEMYGKVMALRIFSFSSGNLRDTVILVRDVYIHSLQQSKGVTIGTFRRVVRGYGVEDEINPFSIDLDKLRLREMVCHSDWRFGSRSKEKSIIDGEYAVYGISKDTKIFTIDRVA